VWTISESFLAAIDDCPKRMPNAARPEIMDAVYMDYAMSVKICKEIDVDAPANVEDGLPPVLTKKKHKQSSNLGSGLGESLAKRVAKQPFTLEMMLRTHQCWIVYDKAIYKDAHANSMLCENGAPMAARFWLSMELLIKVCIKRMHLPHLHTH
jgi:hypothetical protein